MYDVKGDYETVFTGEGDPSLSGLLDTFKGSQHLPQWKGEHCSNITGASDGAKFKSFIQPNDTMKFFRKSLCRTGSMVLFLKNYIYLIRFCVFCFVIYLIFNFFY